MAVELFDAACLRDSKPTQRFIQKWIAALRSGKYKQGQGMLRDRDDRFCCLGVAIDLMAPRSWSRDDFSGPAYRSTRATGDAMMPSEATAEEWCLTGEVDGDEDELSAARVLAKMNDDGKSFKQIALVIERAYNRAMKK